MEEQTTINSIKPSGAAFTARDALSKFLYYARNGQMLYWGSFFILILIEFLLGGQLSKILTKENYSLYANVLNTLPFYNIIVNLGLSFGLVYIIAYHPEIRFSLFRQSLKLQTAWYIILVAVHLVVFFTFRNAYATSLLITVLISYTYTYRLSINSFFTATQSYNKAALANALQKVVLLAVFIVIHYTVALSRPLNDHFVIVYPAIEIGVVVLYFIIFWKTNYLSVKAAKVNYGKRILKYSKYALFNNGLNLLNYSIIAFIIRLARIDISLQIIFLLCIVFFRYTGVAIAPVFAIMNPLFTRIKNNVAAVKKMYRKYYALVFGISIAVFLACRFCFGYIIDNFYAGAYHDLPRYFNFFTWLIPLSFLNSLNASVMSALGKIKYTFKTEVICTTLLGLFFVYSILSPVVNYVFFYYMMLTYLVMKFFLQSYGAYTIAYRR